MGTIIIYAIIAIAVAAALVALLVIVLPEDKLSRPVPDIVPLGLPADREVGAEDLNRMRLPVAVRGYRMVDTDAVLDRLSAEIERRDQEIAELRLAHFGSTDRPAGSGRHASAADEVLEPAPAFETVPFTAAAPPEPAEETDSDDPLDERR